MTTSGNVHIDRDLRRLAKSLADLRQKRHRLAERIQSGIFLGPSQKLYAEGLLNKIEVVRQKMLSMGANPDAPLPPPPESPKSMKKKKRMVTPDPPNARRASGGVGVYEIGSQKKFWS